MATDCRTPHSVVAAAVLEANIVSTPLELVLHPGGSVKSAVPCGISSSRLIGEQTKPVVGTCRFPSSSCQQCLAFVVSLFCQPLPLQRPGESEERAGGERKELGVPLTDIRLRIVCQREDMWRGSRRAGCSTSANPRAAAPRPAPSCDGATSHGATYSQHTGSRPGRHRQTKLLQSTCCSGRRWKPLRLRHSRPLVVSAR